MGGGCVELVHLGDETPEVHGIVLRHDFAQDVVAVGSRYGAR